jgi:hypothetical protein
MPGWLTAWFPKFSQDRLLLVVDLIGTFRFFLPLVLPDGPTTRGAATSWRAYRFA